MDVWCLAQFPQIVKTVKRNLRYESEVQQSLSLVISVLSRFRVYREKE